MASAELPEGEDVARLTRWIDSGGEARVEGGRDGQAVVRLFTCDGGEEMDRFTSSDPAVLRWWHQHGD